MQKTVFLEKMDIHLFTFQGVISSATTTAICRGGGGGGVIFHNDNFNNHYTMQCPLDISKT